MIPITFVRLENYPGFLCSYDNVNWWKSPLPGAINTVIDVCWVYGEYNIAVCSMLDGTYSLYQSYHQINDSPGDLHWRVVLNTAERIRCIIRPDYGIVIIGTSTGWWRSEDSGTTWTKTSIQAPNCFCVKEITNDILIALDGNRVWRSEDGGTTWTKAVCHGTSTSLTAITNYPSIDGTSTDLFVGCTSTNAPYDYDPSYVSNVYYGPFTSSEYVPPIVTAPPKTAKDNLLYSEDGGVSFYKLQPFRGWCYREAITSSRKSQVVLNNGWETDFYTYYTVSSAFPRDTYNDIITDIELTGVNEDGLCQMVIQVKMPNDVMRHYWVRTIVENSGALNAKLWCIAKFDAYATNGNSLTSTEVNVEGTELIDRTALFAGTYDGLPLLKISTDGGNTWTSYDPNNATVYNNQSMTIIGNNPFLDDSYIQYAWAFPICQNEWHIFHNGWHIVSSHLDKRQSYEIGAIVGSSYIKKTLSYNMDVNRFDIKSSKSYYAGVRVVEDKLKYYSIDYHCGKLITEDYDIDGLIGGTGTSYYIAKGSIIGSATRSYQAGSFIVKDEFPTFDIIQALNIRPPNDTERCYPPDSRLE